MQCHTSASGGRGDCDDNGASGDGGDSGCSQPQSAASGWLIDSTPPAPETCESHADTGSRKSTQPIGPNALACPVSVVIS